MPKGNLRIGNIMYEKSKTVASVCALLDADDRHSAISLLKTKAALISIIKQPKLKAQLIRSGNVGSIAMPIPVTKRQYTMFESTCLFIADGFVDRYDGEHLIFPGVLRLLSDIF